MGLWACLVWGLRWRGVRQARQLALWIFPCHRCRARHPAGKPVFASSPIFRLELRCTNAGSILSVMRKHMFPHVLQTQMRSILSCPCRDQRGEQGSSPRLHAPVKYPGQALRLLSTWVSPRPDGKEAWTNLVKKYQPRVYGQRAAIVLIQPVESPACKKPFSSRPMLRCAIQDFDFCLGSTGGRRGYLTEKRGSCRCGSRCQQADHQWDYPDRLGK